MSDSDSPHPRAMAPSTTPALLEEFAMPASAYNEARRNISPPASCVSAMESSCGDMFLLDSPSIFDAVNNRSGPLHVQPPAEAEKKEVPIPSSPRDFSSPDGRGGRKKPSVTIASPPQPVSGAIDNGTNATTPAATAAAADSKASSPKDAQGDEQQRILSKPSSSKLQVPSPKRNVEQQLDPPPAPRKGSSMRAMAPLKVTEKPPPPPPPPRKGSSMRAMAPLKATEKLPPAPQRDVAMEDVPVDGKTREAQHEPVEGGVSRPLNEKATFPVETLHRSLSNTKEELVGLDKLERTDSNCYSSSDAYEEYGDYGGYGDNPNSYATYTDTYGASEAGPGSPSPMKKKKRRVSRRASTFQAATQRPVSGLDQLFAVVSRVALQHFRLPFSLLLEVFVPLLFVAVTIILWAIWGTEVLPETVFVPNSNYVASFYESPEAMSACVNTSAYPEAIGNLPPCASVNYPYVCDGNYDLTPFPAGSICRNSSLRFATLTVAYLYAIVGNLSRVPSLNTIITYQVFAQLDIEPINQLGSVAVSKLYPTMVYNAIVSSGTLYFVGEKCFMDALISHMGKLSSLFPHYSDSTVYGTVAEARKAAPAGSMIWSIVEVKSADEGGLDLVLHMNNSALPSFGTLDEPAYPGGTFTETAELYMASGFNTLQQVVTEFYLQYYKVFTPTQTQMTASFSFPKHEHIPVLLKTRTILPLIFGIAFLYTVSQQTKRIVLEKELRIREAMLIMGLKQWTLYAAEMIVSFIILVVISIVSAIMLKLTYCKKSDPLILVLIFLLFSITTIPLSGVIAAFFSKARLASLMAPVIYFVLVIPTFAMTNARGAIITGFSIFSPSAFCTAINIFLGHETSNGFGGPEFRSSIDNPTMAVILGMLTADFFIYYLLMFYLDAVMPKEWGTPKHPLFFIIDPFRYCCCGKKATRLKGGPDGRDEKGVYETTDYSNDCVFFDGIRKEYSRGGKKFVAVNNLYWGMQEGEISVLLGHNGAGKTTLLNMMTGMIEPDEGDCYISGNSVRLQLEQVRQQLGFCPQHNILWSELTCRDHLEFYGRIKGLKGWELEDASCRMLFETDLLDKMDQPSAALSGGMKRKLSIAVAFVGGSSLVFLDEPTAGLDVAARRYLWELLRRMSQRHTILLTTHYMDEADLLGDRIGIMSQGRLKCTGSSLFLKSRLGVGYNIVISIDPEMDAQVIDDFVLKSVNGAVVQGHNGTELSYQLPSTSLDQFPVFLNEIDSEETTGIRGYALSATTLEEVFLTVSEADLHNGEAAVTNSQMRHIWRCKPADSVWSAQLQAMMMKRFWYTLRDQRMQCFQVVCPVACILIAMLLNLIKFGVPSELVLDYTMFTEPSTPVLLTAGCDSFWGNITTLGGVTRNETHFQSGGMLSNYALDTWQLHNRQRFGGLSCNDSELQAPYFTTPVRNIHFLNTTSHHQGGIALATYYDRLLKHAAGSDSVEVKHTAAFLEKAEATSAMTFIFIGTLIMIPMTFLPSNPVAWIVKERECGARHLQKLCGLNYLIYWLTNYIFDAVAYAISMCLCILIFVIFSRDEFVGSGRVGGTFALFALYGLTSIIGAYALSFVFHEHSNAQMTVMAVNVVLGFLFNVIIFVLQLRTDTNNTSRTLRFIFRIVPSYCIGEGIIDMLMLDSNIAVGRAKGPWDKDQLGWPLIYMAAEFPLFWLITLLVDHPSLGQLLERRRYHPSCKPIIPPDEDPDVTEERAGVYSAEKRNENFDEVRVMDLQKNYGGNKMAVKGISFSIFPGEVFAFLGTNGAGKTTTISMLCQQFLPTGGKAYVCGYDIVKDNQEALQCIGYCPQFDATLDLLTVEEQLKMYILIRGIAKEEHEKLIDALCTLCELTMYRKTVTGALSGGNRRKLSVAMSLVGGPRVLFLDEPSAGMDPVARRGMWTTIQRAAQYCSVVLTTHHLEEVEALADMVAIMVKGYIRCIGDKVHLKNKYGSAFEVSVRIESPRFAKRVTNFFKKEFPSSVLNESDRSRFVYRLPRDRKFGDVFFALQNQKETLHITDYSVSQTSIEQVFLRISETSKQL